jgi:hypothetical protein
MSRHQPHQHHHALTWAALILGSGLILMLVIILRSPARPQLAAPQGTMAGDITTATAGIDQDLSQLGANLPVDSQLDEASLNQ